MYNKPVKVTFINGEVHIAAGRFYSGELCQVFWGKDFNKQTGNSVSGTARLKEMDVATVTLGDKTIYNSETYAPPTMP